jgi:hypothetical protein
MHKRRQFQFPYSERDHGEINCWNSLLPAAERKKERERVRERERERERMLRADSDSDRKATRGQCRAWGRRRRRESESEMREVTGRRDARESRDMAHGAWRMMTRGDLKDDHSILVL